MKKSNSLHLLGTLILAVLCSQCAMAAETSPADSVKTFLHDNFDGKKDCMVIGLVDELGTQVFAGGSLDNGTTNQVSGDSVFFIGSTTKTFTALLLQDMVDRGEIKLDDPAAKYLPKSVKMPTHGGKQITLLQLATHTAGFPHDPSNMTGTGWRVQFETYTIEKLYAYLSSVKLDRDPGTEFEYSNHGMALLGHILALKAGTDFESLLVDRICKPLQMESTRIVPTPEMNTRLAMGHEAGKFSPPVKLGVYAPAGAVHSTVNDLLKYVSAQLDLTPVALAKTMQKTHIVRHSATNLHKVENPGRNFGDISLAWYAQPILQQAGTDVREHAGGAGSYHSWIGFDKKQKRGVVVLTTTDRFLAEQVGAAALQRVSLKNNVLEMVREPVGIGAALEMDKVTHALRIIETIPDSPAAHANLAAGQIIQMIDDVPVAGKTLVDCVHLIRGTEGTSVRLQIFDVKLNKTNSVELTRHKIVLHKQ